MAKLKAASFGQSQSVTEKEKAMKSISINLCIGVVAFSLSTLLIDLAVAQEVEQVPTRFSDVPETHWAAPFIQALATQNIIGGFPDGTFHPNDPVSRAQFAALLNQAFDPTPDEHLSPLRMCPLPTGLLQDSSGLHQWLYQWLSW
jgi:hypothetical protein